MSSRLLLIILAIGVLLAGGVLVLRPAQSAPISATLTVNEALTARNTGFKRVTEPRQFSFPADHGPHFEYATEWWYYTGNLTTADGRRFGFQLTFFRSGLNPNPPQRASDWATSNVYMTHFALTDVSGAKFYAQDRYNRDGAGLAGAQAAPFRVWNGNWQAGGDPMQGTRLQAAQGAVAIDLTVRSAKPPVLQGDKGLSQKSAESGNASYYYSLTRMATDGMITINGQPFKVTGLSWMDREWSTSALAPNQIGWDWFALQLSDNTDLMYYQVRLKDGGIEPLSKGSLTAANGSSTPITRDEMTIEVLDYWTSSYSGAKYPSRWRLTIPKQQLTLEIAPYLADQELPLRVVYWEGAVRFTGTRAGQPISGTGYIEMTGYGTRDQSPVPNRAP